MSASVYAPGPFIGGRQISDSVIGTQVVRTTQSLPQNTTANLFAVTGGAIMVTMLVGQVMTPIGGTAVSLSLGVAPSIGAANNAGLGGPTAITSLVAGTLVTIPFAVGTAGSNLVAPAVPANGVGVTNNYHGTVTVVITGGTWTTGVFINGVNVGAGAGTYQLPAHGVITLNYSVAPTWVWTSSSALVTNANGFVNLAREHILPAGQITWTTTASTTGSIKWYLDYIQLDSQPGFNQNGVGLVN